MLSVSNSSPCNIFERKVCFGEIRRMGLDGSDAWPILTGMGNTVGFYWNPKTGNLWTTDPELSRRCDEFTDPVALLGAHTAPLGMSFHQGDMFGDDHKGQIFIAKHGPWNRTVQIGAEVAVACLDGDTGIARTEPFSTGSIVDNAYVGRPVDVATLPGCALPVSDDWNGAIWRVSRDDQRPVHPGRLGHHRRVGLSRAGPRSVHRHEGQLRRLPPRRCHRGRAASATAPPWSRSPPPCPMRRCVAVPLPGASDQDAACNAKGATRQ
ncbi:MAG: hypothetical protein ABGX10_16485 [Paracoccus sp. (in: a-proteobacteria)]|uniref:PQQ-dependent sugar dehydrogenase n=1 Tax=Paracoccus sp. TaxID=267 RepID=UPI003242EAAF